MNGDCRRSFVLRRSVLCRSFVVDVVVRRSFVVDVVIRRSSFVVRRSSVLCRSSSSTSSFGVPLSFVVRRSFVVRSSFVRRSFVVRSSFLYRSSSFVVVPFVLYRSSSSLSSSSSSSSSLSLSSSLLTANFQTFKRSNDNGDIHQSNTNLKVLEYWGVSAISSWTFFVLVGVKAKNQSGTNQRK